MAYDATPSKITIEKTMAALAERGHLPEFAETRAEALRRIKELIPAGASIMNGASRTLEEIGFVQFLQEGNHGWNNLHAAVFAETDPAKKAALRRQAVLSDFYLGSAHAIAETGEIVVASNSGSQLPHLVYTSPNLILVVGAQKITPDLDSALARLREHVFPLEDARMKSTGAPGSFISKLLVIYREPPFGGRKSHIIFVNEKLGF
ncbi:MAG: lactate utilization protein [Patescibacteria group bacterium]|nr:lactate utilization protein [Patescibacteria group bacterium]